MNFKERTDIMINTLTFYSTISSLKKMGGTDDNVVWLVYNTNGRKRKSK